MLSLDRIADAMESLVESSPEHAAMMRGALPFVTSMMSFIARQNPDWTGSDEDLSLLIGRHLFSAQIQAITAYAAQGKPTIGLCAHLKTYRKHFGALAEKLTVAGFTVIKLYGVVCDDDFEQGSNAFYAGMGMMKFLDCLDAVVITTLSPGLPDQAVKVILLHDIFDSPLGDPKEFLGLACSMDYIFVPSQPSMNATTRVFGMFEETGIIPSKSVQLVPGGYPRLDGNIKAFEKAACDEKTIVYAPTMTLESWQSYASVAQWGRGIIDTIRQSFPDYTVIFRPHPNSHSNPAVAALMSDVAGLSGCEVDSNPSDYMISYGRAKLLVTDMSGTAFTFAFTTGRPVVFFSPNDAEARLANPGVGYFDMRDQVGVVATSLEELPGKVAIALDPSYRAHAEKLCRQAIFNLGQSEDYFVRLLPDMLARRKLPEAMIFGLDP